MRKGQARGSGATNGAFAPKTRTCDEEQHPTAAWVAPSPVAQHAVSAHDRLCATGSLETRATPVLTVALHAVCTYVMLSSNQMYWSGLCNSGVLDHEWKWNDRPKK